MPGTLTPRTDALIAELAIETSETLVIARLTNLAREIEAQLTAAPRTTVIPQAARIVAAAEDAVEAAKEIVRLMEVAPTEHEQRLAASHAEAGALRVDRDQLTASRMHVAHLVAALTVARMAIEQRLGLDALVAANGPTIAEGIDRALGYSETHAVDVLTKARAVVAAAEATRDAASRPGGSPAVFPGLFEAVEDLAKVLPAP